MTYDDNFRHFPSPSYDFLCANLTDNAARDQPFLTHKGICAAKFLCQLMRTRVDHRRRQIGCPECTDHRAAVCHQYTERPSALRRRNEAFQLRLFQVLLVAPCTLGRRLSEEALFFCPTHGKCLIDRMQQRAVGVVLVACIALALIVGDGIDLTARIKDGDTEQRNIMVLTEQFPRRMTDM